MSKIIIINGSGGCGKDQFIEFFKHKKIIVYNICDSKINSKQTFIFIHCREPEEIKKFKKYFKNKCITLLIKRPEFILYSNSSDRNVDKYEYDKILFNNKSLKHLKKLANNFRIQLIGGNICG